MNLKKIPLLLASLGIFAGIQAQDLMEDRVPLDCASLCDASPDFDCGKDFDFLAAAIYEQIRVQGGEIGFITNTRDQALFPVNGYGIYQPEFFSWGFKVGAAYRGWKDNWRTGVKYSYFQAISDSPIQTGYGAAIVPSGYVNNFVADYSTQYYTSYGNVQVGNKTILNDLRFYLGRPSLITENVILDTFYCVEATLLMRRQIQVYTNDVAFGPTAIAPWTNSSASTLVQQRFASAAGGFLSNYQKYTWWGVGPGVGVKGDYYVGKGASIFAEGVTSVRYGNLSTRASTSAAAKTRLVAPPSNYIGDGPGLEAVTINTVFQFSPTIETQLGLNWKYIFDEDQMRVSFQIAYESNYYFNLLKTVKNEVPIHTENGSGLGIQGLILQGSIEF
jgi:hypothetical protein